MAGWKLRKELASTEELRRATAYFQTNEIHENDGDQSNLDIVLTATEEVAIKKYLTNPTKNGIWRLNGVWQTSDEFSAFIMGLYVDRVQHCPTVTYVGTDTETTYDLTRVRLEEVERYISSNLTFVFSVFFCIYLMDAGLSIEQADLSDGCKIVISSIDLNIVKAEYIEAYKIFSEHNENSPQQAAVYLKEGGVTYRS